MWSDVTRALPDRLRTYPGWWLCVAALLCIAPGISIAQEEASPYTLREGGITVTVSGIEATAWDDLRSMLRDQLTLSGNSNPTEPLADDLAFFTRQEYIREGWPNAEVRWDLKGDVISLEIVSGMQIRVGEIFWKGELILPEEEMRKFLLRPSIEREGSDKANPVWVNKELESGSGLVQRRLRAEGYLQAVTVLTPSPDIHPDGLRDLTLEVTAGPRFTFGSVEFSGAPVELDALMRTRIAQTPGEPFNEARVQQLEGQLTSMAKERGWLNAVTVSDYTLGQLGGTVDVVIVMTAGERVMVARVQPHEGFSRGSKRVLTAGFREAEGKYYQAEDLDIMFKRALDTGMFARLDVDPQLRPGVSPATADLLISGEETQPKTLGFELGFDTFLGAQAGVNYRNTNFRDWGTTLAAELNWSVAGPLGSIKLTDPAIFNSGYAASIQIAVENFSLFEYSRNGTSLNLELSRRVSKGFSYTVFTGVSANTVSTDVLTEAEIGPDTYLLGSIGGSLMLDYRDSPVLPRKGWFLSGRLELTGGDVSFVRTDLRGAWYKPITKKFRFAAGGGLLSIQGASTEELPIDSRVFNGGPNTVRSFAERELGPVTNGNTPLGGTAAIFANAEFSYEIYPNLELALFTDFGSLAGANNGSPFDYSSDFRTAVGAGLRYKLPFGPIRIDYGHNLDAREGEKSGMLHVTVGFAF
ncbi:Beta-barrel assembly machine subunit BamA [Prosthecobacter fusiformis]|uniref:Beta-barrel assembly machine subunit BamA n=1 Tax=Prosthecobacter fusiformis TaxID=48464 RepID=A0A4R7SSD0_9BACT|nr:BamA/TamA family outer membrane protein [Prosthecobacter fusiformis]TDU81589.1 Beta-barrel assembly machine subunit BamA [Prosthecobacter fusiformis]